MNKEEKTELVKRCVLAINPDVDEEDWNDMLNTDGFKGFLLAVEMAMDLHFGKQASNLLRFVRMSYRPQAPNLREWYDEKRKVVVSEDGLLIAFGINQNIKDSLAKTKEKINETFIYKLSDGIELCSICDKPVDQHEKICIYNQKKNESVS